MPQRGLLTLTLGAFGRRVAVHGPDALLAVVRERLPSNYLPTSGAPEREWCFQASNGRWSISVSGRLLAAGCDRDQALVRGLSDLELWVGEHAEGLIFVHAGSVVHRGRAIILPGHTMFGKTTLTLALVAAGATYYSDEFAVFDAEGRIHPYRRRPSIRPAGTGFPALTPPIDFASTESHPPVPLALAARLTYDARNGWDVEARTRSQGVLATMEHALAAQSRSVEVLDALTRASPGALFLSGTRGGAEVTAHRLLNHLDR